VEDDEEERFAQDARKRKQENNSFTLAGRRGTTLKKTKRTPQ